MCASIIRVEHLEYAIFAMEGLNMLLTFARVASNTSHCVGWRYYAPWARDYVLRLAKAL
jgi:hypothetical protein